MGLGFGLNCRVLMGVIGAATVHGCRRELMSMMQTRLMCKGAIPSGG